MKPQAVTRIDVLGTPDDIGVGEASHTDLPWHCRPVAAVFGGLSTTSSGLTAEEAARRLKSYGANELQALGHTTIWQTLAAQFKNVLILILLAATLLSGLLGHGLEAAVIAVIVLFAVLLGFIQEYRAERALEALRALAAPRAHVVRDGVERSVPASEVVVGDVVALKAGDRVPADVRIMVAANLAMDEAALTGESHAIEKTSDALTDPTVALGDRRNMAFSGTLVTYGRGLGVVVATGIQTEFGRISGMVQSVKPGRTPLQENLDRLGRSLSKAALVIVTLIVMVGIWRGQPLLEMLVFGIALAVAVVPEALPAVVTISLAIGVRRMAKRNALVRRLPVVETLGSTSVICSDKTGTLTRNEMTVREVFAGGRSFSVSGAGYEPAGEFSENGVPLAPSLAVLELLRGGLLASDARVIRTKGRWQIEGDPTEGALVVAAAKAGLDQDTLNEHSPRLDEMPFSSERRRMTTLHAAGPSRIAYSKGAADAILPDCTSALDENGTSWVDERRFGGRPRS